MFAPGCPKVRAVPAFFATLLAASAAHAQPSIAPVADAQQPSSQAAAPVANTPQPAPTAGAARTDVVRSYWMADLYLVAGINQLVGGAFAGFRHRWDQPRSDNVFLDNRRFEVGVEVAANPAFLAVGAYAEWTPIQPLVLRAQTDLYGYLGLFGAIRRYETSGLNEDWSDNARSMCPTCRPGLVQRALGRVILRGQLGPIVLHNQSDFGFYALHGDEPFYLLPEHDILIARRDVMFINDAQLLVEPYRRADKTGLYIGPMYSYARALVAGVQRQRISLFSEWVFHRKLGPFARPRILGFAGYHIEDRNRGGGFIGFAGLGTEFDL